MLRSVLAIALTALIVSACSTSRQTMRSDVRSRTGEARDSVRVEQVMVAVHDTIKETTTITVRENEAGDTLRVSRVTERDRVRDRTHVKSMEVDVRVVRDTVYIAKRDSVLIKNEEKARASPLLKILKWSFWIVVGLIALTVVLKIRR